MNNDQIKNEAIQEENLAKYDGEDKVISSYEMQKIIEAHPKVENQIFCSIPTLDRMVDGFVGGELVVVAGATGMGKTSLMETITANLATQEIDCLWFTYEVQPRYFLQRFHKLPLFYMPTVLKDRSLNWIKQRIIEAKIKYGIKAVMIDHLHYLIDMVVLRNPSLEIGSVVRQLKLLAVEENLIIFLAAHLAKTKLFEEVELSNIRDSSLISQESDQVLLIWRIKEEDMEYGSRSVVKVDKSRRTGVIDKKIKLIFKHGLLREETAEGGAYIQ